MTAALFFRKFRAFLKRDLIENMSYRFAFVVDVIGVAAHIVIFFFVAKLLSGQPLAALEPYGGNYFPFVLIGIALAGYQTAALQGFSRSIQNEIGYGTLEAILMTPTNLNTVILSGAIWTFTVTSLRIGVYLLIGSLFFGADLSHIHLGSALLTLILSITALSGIGIFSAGIILIFKKGDPVSHLVSGASRLLSGVYFPLALFPDWLEGWCRILPLTHSLSAMRKAVLQNQGILGVQSELTALFLFSLVLLPLGLFFFRRAVIITKKQGSLTFY